MRGESRRISKSFPLADARGSYPAKVLKEPVAHHAEEETMFKRARKVFPGDELDEFGAQLAQREEELIREHATAD